MKIQLMSELAAKTTPPKPKHIHEYQRSRSNKLIYRCVHPDCTHYTQKEFLEGKRALCRKCKDPFILTADQLKNLNPVCLNCSKSKKAERVQDMAEVLSGLFMEKEA